MYQFFTHVIRPALEAIDASSILEVGADQGAHTRLLQDWCRDHGATLHVIETEPSDALLGMLDDDVTVLHVGTSHEVIPQLPAIDAAMIDGDHNHFTVTGEIDRLADLARGQGRGVPLMCFHDVGWPYGRRDMYYAPDRVPDNARQEWSRDAILIGQSDLQGPPGFNFGFANATHEGGPRNGVLTGVEDAIADLGDVELTVIPGVHGLGFAVPRPLLDQHEALRAIWDQLSTDTPLKNMLQVVEDERLLALEQVYDEAWEKAQAQDREQKLHDELASADARATAAEAQVAAVEADREVRDQELADAKEQLAELTAFRDRVVNHPVMRVRDVARRLLNRGS